MTIAEKVQTVRRELSDAAPERKVNILAATKTWGPEIVREAVAADVDFCGENRVQELTEKSAAHAYDGKPVHFIGHLQRNKVRQVVGHAALIHSVDSEELLTLIDRQAEQLGIRQDILLQVNIAGEASKSGVSPDGLYRLLDAAGEKRNILVRGLMAIPPISTAAGANRGYFARMYQLFVDIGAKKYDNTIMDFLSMGMSRDYLDAVAEGSNLIRLGRALFGERSYR